MQTTANQNAVDYAAMTDYLENLLARQTERLRQYDLDGAFDIAEETGRIAQALTQAKALDRPELLERKRRLENMYREICLIISDQRQEVSDKMKQIRHGIKALGGYSGK